MLGYYRFFVTVIKIYPYTYMYVHVYKFIKLRGEIYNGYITTISDKNKQTNKQTYVDYKILYSTHTFQNYLNNVNGDIIFCKISFNYKCMFIIFKI